MTGDPVRSLEVRCGSLRHEHAPHLVQNAAGNFEQRSVEPCIVTLLKVDMQDVAALRGISWTHIGWGGSAQTVKYEVPPIQMSEDDLRCI